MGVLHHGNYFQYFEWGRTELMRKMGISYAEFEESGYLLPVIKAEIQYKKPIPYDTLCELTTGVMDVQRIRFSFQYEIRRNEKLLTEGSTDHTVIDKDGKLVKMPEILKSILNGEKIK